MSVYLQKFSKNRVSALKQSLEIHSLIRKEKDGLVEAQSFALKGCDEPLAVFKRVGRIATSELLQAFIIRGQRRQAGLGIATIVFNQTVENQGPEKWKFQGDHLDYCLSQKFRNDQDLHNQVATALIKESHRISIIPSQNPPHTTAHFLVDEIAHHRVFATINKNKPNLPIGFMGLSESNSPFYAYNEPVVLDVPDNIEDTLELTQKSEVVQFFYGGGSLTKPSNL